MSAEHVQYFIAGNFSDAIVNVKLEIAGAGIDSAGAGRKVGCRGTIRQIAPTAWAGDLGLCQWPTVSIKLVCIILISVSDERKLGHRIIAAFPLSCPLGSGMREKDMQTVCISNRWR